MQAKPRGNKPPAPKRNRAQARGGHARRIVPRYSESQIAVSVRRRAARAGKRYAASEASLSRHDYTTKRADASTLSSWFAAHAPGTVISPESSSFAEAVSETPRYEAIPVRPAPLEVSEEAESIEGSSIKAAQSADKVALFKRKKISLGSLYREYFFPALGGLMLAIAAVPFLAILGASAATGVILPNGDHTTGWAQCNGGNCSSPRYTYINEDATGSPDTSTHIGTGGPGASTASARVEFEVETIPNVESVTSVTIRVLAMSATNANGGTLDELDIHLVANEQVLERVSVVPQFNSWGVFTAQYTGDWSQEELDNMRIRLQRFVRGSGNPTNQQDNIRVAALSADIEYSSASELEQNSYRWLENENSSEPTDEYRRLDPPDDTLPNNGFGTTFSPDGSYMVMTHESAPVMTVYSVNQISNTFTKVSDANISEAPAGNIAFDVAFSPDGSYLAVAHQNSPFLSIYTVDQATDTFTKLPNTSLSELPNGTGRAVHFSPDGSYLAFAGQNAPYMAVYEVDAENDTFDKLSNPSNLPQNVGYGAVFHPVEDYVAIAHANAPYISVYELDTGTNTLTRVPAGNFSELPPEVGYSVDFSPDGSYMSVGNGVSQFVTIYSVDIGTETFTKVDNPDVLPPNNGLGTAFSGDGRFLAVSHFDAPFLTMYEIDEATDTFTKLNTPSTGELPPNHTYGVAFSPDSYYITAAHATAPYLSIYQNNRIANSGDSIASQDTPVTLSEEGDPFRLRASLSADQGDVAAGALELRLQYAQLDPGDVCSVDFSGQDYSDVPSSLFDPSNWDTVDNPYSIPEVAFGSTFSHDGNTLVKAHTGGNGVTFVDSSSADPSNWSPIANSNIDIAGSGISASFTNDDAVLAIGHSGAPHVTLIDASDPNPSNWTEINSSLSVPGNAWFMEFSNDNDTLAIGHVDGSHVTLVDSSDPNPENWSIVSNSNISIGGTVFGAAFTSDDDALVLTHNEGTGVTFVDASDPNPANWSPTSNQIQLPGSGRGIAFKSDDSVLTLGHGFGNRITYVDTTDPDPENWSVVQGNIVLPNGALDLTFSADDNVLVALHVDGAGVTFIDSSSSNPANWSQITNSNIALPDAGRSATFSVDNNTLVLTHSGADYFKLVDISPGDEHIMFYNNSNIPDGSSIVSSPDDPSPGTGSAVHQSYVESNNFTNTTTIQDGDYGIWDFSLVDNGAPADTTYCFRIVYSGGSELEGYSVIPELTIPPPIYTQADYRWYEQGEVTHSTFAYAEGLADHDYYEGMTPTGDGGFLVTGWSRSNLTTPLNRALVAKFTSEGELEWRKAFGGNASTSAEVFFNAIEVSDGYVLSGYGTTGTPGYFQGLIAKFDFNGGLVWAKTAGGSENDQYTDITETSDGGLAVVGYTESTNGSGRRDALAAKYDSEGNLLWVNHLEGTGGDDVFDSVIETADGTLLAVGRSVSLSSGVRGGIMVDIDQSDGSFGSAVMQDDSAQEVYMDIEQTEDGGLVIVGYTNSVGQGTAAALITKLDDQLNIEWSKTFGGSGIEIPNTVHQNENGDFIVGGYTSSFRDGQNNGMLAEVSSSGDLNYFKTYGGADTDYFLGAGILEAGSLLMSGYGESYGEGGWDGLFVKTDENGDIEACGSFCESHAATISDSGLTVSVSSVNEINLAWPDDDSASSLYNMSLERTVIEHNPIDMAGGDPLAEQNQPIEIAADGSARLRMLVHVDDKSALGGSFKLQYAMMLGDSCATTFNGESYEDVGGEGAYISFKRNGITTGIAIGANQDDPESSRQVIPQNYVESNNFSISSLTGFGEAALFDFSIQDTGGGGGVYCFRIVRANGSLLDGGYSHVAGLSTPPRASQQLRHGRWFDVGEQSRPFYW